MTLHLTWKELIPRLEADLQAGKQLSAPSYRDYEAWEVAAHLLRDRTRFLLLKYPDLHEEDAEDIVQNVMVKLQSLETMRRLRAARSTEGYIFVILRNAVIDFIRHRQGGMIPLRELDYHVSVEPTFSYDLPADRSPALAKALTSLTEDERFLLKLRFWRNMSIGQIAAKTEKSYSATAVNLFRILRRLRKRMTEQK